MAKKSSKQPQGAQRPTAPAAIADHFHSFLPSAFVEPFIAEALRELESGSSEEEAIRRALVFAEFSLPPIDPAWDLVMEHGDRLELKHPPQNAEIDSPAEDEFLVSIHDIAEAMVQAQVDLFKVHRDLTVRICQANPEPVAGRDLGFLLADLMLGTPPIILSPIPPLAQLATRENDEKENVLEDAANAVGIPLTVAKKVKAVLVVLLSAAGVEFLVEVALGDLTLFRLFFDLYTSFRAKDTKKIKSLLGRILKHLSSPNFRRAIIKKLGDEALETFLGKIAARLIPFLGYALLIGTVIYVVYKQWGNITDP
jgi:hypothetical protein